MLVRPGFEPTASRSADWRLSHWANRAVSSPLLPPPHSHQFSNGPSLTIIRPCWAWENHSHASPFACVRVYEFTWTRQFLLRIVLWDKKNGIDLCFKFACYFAVYWNNSVLKQVPNFDVKKSISPTSKQKGWPQRYALRDCAIIIRRAGAEKLELSGKNLHDTPLQNKKISSTPPRFC